MMIKPQSGSTLVIVLIVVLALTIIGTLAIRQSLISFEYCDQWSSAATINAKLRCCDV